jgi:hypothetical protein
MEPAVSKIVGLCLTPLVVGVSEGGADGGEGRDDELRSDCGDRADDHDPR